MMRKGRYAPDPATQDLEDEVESKLSAAFGRNLRQLRQKRGFSLGQLAEISKVSRAMLGQIETGKSAPTINTVGLIAQALKVSISTLLTGQMPLTTVVKFQNVPGMTGAADARSSSRVIAAWRDLSGAEVHGISLGEGRGIHFGPASEGIKKSIIVTSGTLGIEIGDQPLVTLSADEAIIFCANQNHVLRNLGSTDARAFLVIAGMDMFNWQEDRPLLIPIAPGALR
jgi:transcriptional regulator with XRE-family HTH domain